MVLHVESAISIMTWLSSISHLELPSHTKRNSKCSRQKWWFWPKQEELHQPSKSNHFREDSTILHLHHQRKTTKKTSLLWHHIIKNCLFRIFWNPKKVWKKHQVLQMPIKSATFLACLGSRLRHHDGCTSVVVSAVQGPQKAALASADFGLRKDEILRKKNSTHAWFFNQMRFFLEVFFFGRESRAEILKKLP